MIWNKIIINPITTENVLFCINNSFDRNLIIINVNRNSGQYFYKNKAGNIIVFW
jgi:hypothetical protein